MKSILKLREKLYEWKIFRSFRLPVFVISVGNISVGGTGKSPLTILLAEWALERSLRPIVLTRGYGRKLKAPVLLQPNDILPNAEKIGDEPLMIKLRLPNISMLIHSKRVKKALQLWHNIKANVVLMDDAFQHWQAIRDLDVVTVDATENIFQATLPFGRLREPADALSRADIVLITRANEISKELLDQLAKSIETILRNRAKKVWQEKKKLEPKIFFTQYKFSGVCDSSGNRIEDNGFFAHKKVILVSGIAKPKSFSKLVSSLGAKVVEEVVFSDHHFLKQSDINKIVELSKKLPEAVVLVTEKDWARWGKQLEIVVPFYFLRVEIDFIKPEKKEFFELLNKAYECTIL